MSVIRMKKKAPGFWNLKPELVCCMKCLSRLVYPMSSSFLIRR